MTSSMDTAEDAPRAEAPEPRELRRGQVVRIVEPGPYASQAAFRNRVGVVVYPLQKPRRKWQAPLPLAQQSWVIAVERMEREKVMSAQQASSAENLFEFIVLNAYGVVVLDDDAENAENAAAEAPREVPKPEWIVSRFAPYAASEEKRESVVRGRLSFPRHERAARVAVIVPFRDAHAAQKRQQQLEQFVPYMGRFLRKHALDFRILVIEQSRDGRKFNRGQLLNVGFLVAKAEGCDAFVFHDVDLLPSEELGPWYAIKPAHPVHVARVWDRYAKQSEDYFGGVAAWGADDFERINGFPNNYWGWGGEDDEMMRRCKTVFGERFQMDAPTAGSLRDLEDMSLDEKLAFLRQHPTWKCNVRWELRDAHVTSWFNNGLRVYRPTGTESPLPQHVPFAGYKLAARTVLDCDDDGDSDTPRALRVTVVLGLHGDWTDSYAPEPVEGAPPVYPAPPAPVLPAENPLYDKAQPDDEPQIIDLPSYLAPPLGFATGRPPPPPRD